MSLSIANAGPAPDPTPSRISRRDALARIRHELGAAPCLICAIRDGAGGPQRVLARGRHARLVLSRYPIRWGHLLVLLDDHVTRFEELALDAWQESTALALDAATSLETALDPVRCYIASLGSAHDGLPMTSPHLHLHVIPLYHAADKPSGVLTWEHGVYAAPEAAWQGLQQRLAAAWPTRPR